MQTAGPQTPGPTITPFQTVTRTDGVACTDNLKVAETFVTRANARAQRLAVEEDSADVYLSERCSPLNDF